MASARVSLDDERYLAPLVRDARLLLEKLLPDTQVILLGSIATPKYVAPLVQVFGRRLLFPGAFVGRGDMSRGGLLLRCSRAENQLEYVPVATAVLRGVRPPKLPRPPRRRRAPGR